MMESTIGMRELLFEIHLMQRVNLDPPRAGRNDAGNDDWYIVLAMVIVAIMMMIGAIW